jgi:hypothetical protein
VTVRVRRRGWVEWRITWCVSVWVARSQPARVLLGRPSCCHEGTHRRRCSTTSTVCCPGSPPAPSSVVFGRLSGVCILETETHHEYIYIWHVRSPFHSDAVSVFLFSCTRGCPIDREWVNGPADWHSYGLTLCGHGHKYSRAQ